MTTCKIVVLDVGAMANLGWAALDADGSLEGPWQLRRIGDITDRDSSESLLDRGTSLESLVSCVADALEREVPVALGFECPAFVPVRRNESELLAQRCGEDGAPFAASAGALALVVGLVESAWVLSRLGAWGRTATVDPSVWPTRHPLFLWEAFVSRAGKTGADSRSLPSGWSRPDDTDHVRDAATAVAAFARQGVPALVTSDIDSCGEPAFNTVAAAALRAGLTSDIRELSRRAYVVKAR